MTAPLTLQLVRTQVAEGAVAAVDADAARAHPGVALVLTADGLADGAGLQGRPLLASGPITHQGQEVAAVIADNPYVATDAAELLDVEIDFDVVGEDESTTPQAADDGPGAVVRQPRWHVAPLRTQRCEAVPVGDAVEVRLAVRDPEGFAASLAAAAGLDPAGVSVLADDRGPAQVTPDRVCPGHVLTVLAAQRLGRPVRWEESRTESLTTGGAEAGFTGAATLTSAGSLRLQGWLAAEVGAHALDPGRELGLPALPWYAFDEVAIEVRHQVGKLPPARTASVEVLGTVMLAEAAIAESALANGLSRDDLRAELLRHAGPAAAELLRRAASDASSATAGPAPSAIGTALGPGVGAAVGVELDETTGEWRALSINLAVAFRAAGDVGLALDAGAVDGYGLAAMQEMEFDDQGTCLAATLMDYVMPSSWEVPLIGISEVVDGEPSEVGVDAARLLATAAVAQAARDAASRLAGATDALPAVLTSSVMWEAARR